MATDAAAGELSLREIVDLVADAVDARGGDRATAWERVREARASATPLSGRVLLAVDAGVFLYIGAELYGFAPRHELPMWVPRRPRAAIGRQLEGLVAGVDEEVGMVLLSPRLLALRRARKCLGISKRVSGRILSADLAGLVVDLGGAKGFAPRAELELDWLLAGPERGARWRGYVLAMGDAMVLLSRFGPDTRRARAKHRERTLAQLVPGSVHVGRVVATGGGGALVAFDGGLVTGLVPRPALASPAGARLVPDARLPFLVVGRPEHADDDADVHLWPAPRSG